jgi:hypothetical protein
MILDEIFGYGNFRNEIAWCYRGAGYPKKDFGRRHDNIYRYSKTNDYIFNVDDVRVPYAEATQERFKHYIGNVRKGKDFGQQSLNPKGRHPDDWWEIQPIAPSSKDRIGYPTQKPESLLEIIVKASSNPGDIVLDPFVGGGTTIVVADRLNRRWIGIDQSVTAIKVSEMRFKKQRTPYGNSVINSFIVQLHKYDGDVLLSQNPFEFENWIIGQFGGIANVKQRGDSGIDGKTKDNTPIQVKQSKNIGRNVVDNFLSAINRVDNHVFSQNIKDKKPVGFIIAFSFSKGAVEEVARLENSEDIIIKLVRVSEIIPLSTKPTLKIELFEISKDENGVSEIEIIATGNSDSGIEFYSWDFDYNESEGFKADIMIDKTGNHKGKFPAGSYNIAVKVVDNDGLENIEVVKFNANGKIDRVINQN